MTTIKNFGRPPEDHESYVGTRYGRLIIQEILGMDKNSIVHTKAVCDCGTEKRIRLSDLKSGRTVSCGCNRNEQNSKRLTKHGGKGTRLYDVWCCMKARCENHNDLSYANYGARGISVCESWQDFAAFRGWANTNGYKQGLSIDRINNDKGYSPDNCRWADNFVQANNKRRSIKITFQGKTMSLSEWARELNMDPRVIHQRIYKLGWSHEEALTKPVRKMKFSGHKTASQVAIYDRKTPIVDSH